ncbi:WD40 repeat-like protein, partial [Sistotremastrum suecicum HHB10207 ss-3]
MAYRLSGRLNAHHGTIHCLTFDNDGHFLCSGADDQRAIIWSMDTKSQFQEFYDRDWGAIRSVKWLGEDDMGRKTLGIGCESGVLNVYRQNRHGGGFSPLCSITLDTGSVESMAFERSRNCLAVGGEAGDISMYKLPEGEGSLSHLWTVQLPASTNQDGTIICDLIFCHDLSSLEVCCRHTGVVYSLDKETGIVKAGGERHTNSAIANVSISTDERY